VSEQLFVRTRTTLVKIVTRYNRKTVAVITDAGLRWNVAPRLLGKADSGEQTGTDKTKDIPLRKN
jgi:hypothetical protein